MVSLVCSRSITEQFDYRYYNVMSNMIRNRQSCYVALLIQKETSYEKNSDSAHHRFVERFLVG